MSTQLKSLEIRVHARHILYIKQRNFKADRQVPWTFFEIPLGHIVERGTSVATRMMRGQFEREQNPTSVRGLKGKRYN